MKTKFYYFTILSLIIFSGFKTFAQSYTQDFSAGILPAGANGGGSYAISVVNQELVAVVNKSVPWDGLQVATFSPVNLSNIANRTLSFDIKADTTINSHDFNLLVQVFSDAGYATSSGKLIAANSKYRRVSFSFAPNSENVNWSTITGFKLVVQSSNNYTGKLYFDNFALGAAATNLPYFKSVPTQYTSINSGPRSIKIQQPLSANIFNQNVSFSVACSNPTLIPSISFANGTIPSSTASSAGNAQSGIYDGRTALLNYTPAANQFGMATVTITATTTNTIAGVTLSPSNQVFTIVVNKNVAPTINIHPSFVAIGSDVTSTIDFDRILSGNPEVTQLMTITGISSDQAVIANSNIVASYTGLGLVAKIFIKPVQFASFPVKTCNIVFTIKDDGGTALGGIDQSSITIPVTVYPTLYNSPYFDPIADQNDLITAGVQNITITGINDGNGSANIGSLNAISSNTSIMPNPTIKYFKGDDYAILSYNISNLGSVVVSVTAINAGAPVNSNGNTAFDRTFNIVSILPPINGYVEDFTTSASKTVFSDPVTDIGVWRTSPLSKWYSEHDGTQLTTTVNTTTGTVNVSVNKHGLSNGLWFAGLWYKPDPINTFNFALYPYMSVKLSASYISGDAAFSPNLPIAIDLWDVNNNRYGLNTYVSVGPTEATYTFCYNGTPSSSSFDFTKVKTILFNFPALGSAAQFFYKDYSGTVTIRDIRLGDQALGAGSCPGNTPYVRVDTLFSKNYLTTQAGPKVITLTGINAGYSPITGNNTNPVTLSLNSTGPISFSLGPVTNGNALLSFNTLGTIGTSNITITGSASGSLNNKFIFQVIESTLPGTLQAVINNNVNGLHPDGFKGQTMDGFGATLQSNVGGGDSPLGYQAVNPTVIVGIKDQGVTMARMAIAPNFEYNNDNNDPYSINFGGFDENSLNVDLYMAYKAAGVQRFIGTCWSTPSWTKYNKLTTSPYADNTIDTAYIPEIAEFFTAYVLALKQRTGIELYAIDFVNEPQFNEPYTSNVINPQQYILIMNAVVSMFNTYGIKTLIFGPETLSQDANAYVGAIAADPIGRNNFSAHARHNYADDGVAAGSLAWKPILTASRDSRLNGGMTRYLNNPLTSPSSTGNGSTGIPVWMTETSGNAPNWAGAMNYGTAIQSAINYGNLSAWTYWNYAGGSLLDQQAQITPQGPIKVYYAQKHFSKYVYPGAVRVPASVVTTSGVFVSSFQNAASSKYGSSLVTVFTNSNSAWASVSVSGTSLPSVHRVFQSYQGSYWVETGTTSGLVLLPPNSMTTLWGNGTALVGATSVSITGAATSINTPGGKLQLSATVFPTNIPDGNVTWSVTSVSGSAIIDQTGLVTAKSNGVVSVKATSVNTPSIFGTYIITITGQVPRTIISVTGLTITGNAGSNTITTPGGGFAMLSNFSPSNASNQAVDWSVSPNTKASISNTGILTSLDRGNGVVTVTGVSVDGGFSSSYVVTISNQSIHMTSLTLFDPTGKNGINIDGAVLGLGYTILPTNTSTSQRSITYTVLTDASGGDASVEGDGYVTAISDGIVTIVGTSVYDPDVTAFIVLTITGQRAFTEIRGLTVNKSLIDVPGGSITVTGVKEFYSGILPLSAIDELVWSFAPPTSLAGGMAIDSLTGVITSKDAGNGTVTVIGISKLNPSIISKGIVITIINQTDSLYLVIGEDGVDSSPFGKDITNIKTEFPTVYAIFTPTVTGFNRNAFMKWSVEPAGIISIDSTGLITGLSNGMVEITGVYGNNPLVSGKIIINVDDPTLSIESKILDQKVKVYPNPSSGIVNVELKAETGNSSVNVYNSTGRLVLTRKMDVSKFSLDLSDQPNGLYSFVISTDKGVVTKQVVIH